MDAYKEFLEIAKKRYVVEYVEELLDWDKQVLMPPGGAEARAQQASVLAGLIHDTITSPRLGELLAELESKELSPDQAANVREVRREYDKACRIPEKLVGKIARKTSRAYNTWVRARKNKDFSMFAPALAEVVELKREYARLINPEKDPYENLLHEYEPWFSIAEVDELFTTVKDALVPLIKQINDDQDVSFLRADVDQEAQLAYNKHIAEVFGFDFNNGRIDLAVHPFTVHPADVRITTRFSDGWWPALASTMHEVGHGLYEQHLPKEHYATPRGTSAYMAVHESQSRLWENQVGHSRWFWQDRFPDLKERYTLPCSFDEFYRGINRVKQGFIRVNADELTYPLHVILRYEIEKALIAGDIEVADLPRVWNEKMQEYLGVTPPDDALGVLQDVHWSTGAFGYFPTYLLGNILSGQLFAAANTTDIDILGKWLREHVHEKGRLLSTQDLIKQATGNEPRPDEYLEYLGKKYGELYGLE